MYAKFQLSRLIMIFITFYSCYQLLTADDSCYKKIKWDFHLLPKCDVCVKVDLCRLLGGLARKCDANRQTDTRRQVKIGLTQPYLAGA